MKLLRLVPGNRTLARKINLARYDAPLRGFVSGEFSGVRRLDVGRSYISMLVDDDFDPAGLPRIGDHLRREDARLRELVGADAGDWLVRGDNAFYAVSVDHITDFSQGSMIYGPTFEVVYQEDLEPFLGETPEGLVEIRDHCDAPLRRVLDAYLEDGLDGPRFSDAKSAYLGHLNFCHMHWLGDNVPEFRERSGKWYEFYADAAFEEASAVLYTEVNPGEPENYFLDPVLVTGELYFMDKAVVERLRQLFSIAPVNPGLPDLIESGVTGDNAVAANTVFKTVKIFDIGQGLCVGIYDDNDELQAFFDFGMPYLFTRPNPNLAPDLQAVTNEIDAAAQAGRVVHVILSHWHLDHCVIARLCTPEQLRHMRWMVPENGLASTAQEIRESIANAGGVVQTYKQLGPGSTLKGNRNFRVGKINSHNHLHHQGMYARLQLTSGTTVYLAGDTTYNLVPAGARSGVNESAGFDVLQACHHGGNYHLSPVDHDYHDIPSPVEANSFVIYSAGDNNSHGHPDAEAVQDHTDKGWATSYCTIDAATIVVT